LLVTAAELTADKETTRTVEGAITARSGLRIVKEGAPVATHTEPRATAILNGLQNLES
jgi:hypothetical protein